MHGLFGGPLRLGGPGPVVQDGPAPGGRTATPASGFDFQHVASY